MVDDAMLRESDVEEDEQAVAGPELTIRRKRKLDRYREWFKRALLAGAVLMLLLIAFAAKFDALQAENVLEQANIARSLARGDGLRSPSTQPLSHSLAPDAPERVLYAPPAYPVMLAGVLKAAGAKDRAVGLTAVVFLILTLALVYLISVQFLDERVAMGAVVVCVLTVPYLQHVAAGTEIAFLGFLVTALFGLLLWWTRSVSKRSDWWPLGASLLIALCWLTRYEMLVLLPTVIVFWLHGSRRLRWRRVLLTVIPFALIAGLWIARNVQLLDRPIVSPWSYYLLGGTSLYTTSLITRIYEQFAPHPWAMALDHPGMITLKVLGNLRQLYYAIPNIGNAFITAFFLVGVVIASSRRQLALLHWCLLLAIALATIAAALYVGEASLLLCFMPLISMFAVRKLIEILEVMIQRRARVTRRGVNRAFERVRIWLGIRGPDQGTDRLVVFGLVMLCLLAAYPTADYLFLQPAAQRTPLVGAAQAVGKLDYGLVASNVPQALTWYGEVPTVGLPASAMQLNVMISDGIVPDAIYLVPTAASIQMRFEGFERVERPGVMGILWERTD